MDNCYIIKIIAADIETFDPKPRCQKNAIVALSKALSWLLRHGAVKEDLIVRRDGFIFLDEVLVHKKIRKYNANISDIKNIVKTSDKQRFAMGVDNEGDMWIRANQGHSFPVPDLQLKTINNILDLPNGIAVHGTYKKAWEIIKSKGLSKMKREHIHMAIGLPDEGVISGMRKTVQVLIYIDVEKCLEAGIPLFLSTNGVILSPGNNNGIIPPELFLKVDIK